MGCRIGPAEGLSPKEKEMGRVVTYQVEQRPLQTSPPFFCSLLTKGRTLLLVVSLDWAWSSPTHKTHTRRHTRRKEEALTRQGTKGNSTLPSLASSSLRSTRVTTASCPRVTEAGYFPFCGWPGSLVLMVTQWQPPLTSRNPKDFCLWNGSWNMERAKNRNLFLDVLEKDGESTRFCFYCLLVFFVGLFLCGCEPPRVVLLRYRWPPRSFQWINTFKSRVPNLS